MRRTRGARRLAVAAALAAGIAASPAAPALAAPAGLDLDHLTAQQAEGLLDAGEITSVELTKAYIARIEALNKRGPGLNAVTQFNRDALVEAAAADKARAEGKDLGPAMGVPILLKDIVDAKGMYTSAGNFSLRGSFPAEDSGVAKNLRAHGVVILGKLGLSEFANFFGGQPSGFSNLTGQVLNAIDADQTPSGSSSGSGAAAAASLSALTIGTETNGSIISPSSTQGIVGLRPTVGLVPGYGIAPIYASQDTAGPMVRSVADAAMTLQSIAGKDPQADAEYREVFGDDYLAKGVIPAQPDTVPDYMSALDLDYVKGKRIGYRGALTSTDASNVTTDTPLGIAVKALRDAGATVVEAPAQVNPTGLPAAQGNYEAHKTIDSYYAHLGPDAPIKNMQEEVARNQAEAKQALKFGNATHASVAATDTTPGGANETAFRAAIVTRKAAYHKSIDDVMANGTPQDTSDDFIAVLGSLSNAPVAGYPQITVPMGYAATTRRALNVSVYGGAYDERDLLGVAYVVEQATKLRQQPDEVNPSMYRCAKTTPAPAFSGRGHCNPDYDTIMARVGTAPDLGFSLENATVKGLQARLAAGTLTSEQLTKAYLARIALANAEGPAVQAVRSVDLDALDAARRADQQRSEDGDRGPLFGIPVLVSSDMDVAGQATSAGSIALQDTAPARDATLVRRLKAAGAIVLGTTNVTELNGVFDANMPEGYSSLGGQVLLPNDTDKTPAGSSAGAAAAATAGLAAMTVGLETSTDTAQLVAPASAAGVVGLKPTVGRVSRTGVLGVAKSQDSPGPIAKSVYDVAVSLQAMAARDAGDAATSGAPAPADYAGGLRADALSGKRIGVVTSSAAPYPSATTAIADAGATTVTKTVGTPSPNPDSVVTREFKRDLNAYLATTPGGAGSLQGIIDYNAANATEGLKYQQGELLAAQATDISDTSSAAYASYETDRDTGRTGSRQLIDGLLANGTPNDATDDLEAMAVPATSALVGIADRAGYPVLTVPAGYNAATGRNPGGVAFIGTAYSEATLLADGYAFEQQTRARQAPSETNPSMWRCVPGSSFFTGEYCNPGDRAFSSAFNPVPVDAPAVTPTAEPTAAATAQPTPGSATSPAATPTPAPSGGVAGEVESKQLALLKAARKLRLSGRTLSFTERFLTQGTAKYSLRLSGVKRGKRRLTVPLAKVTLAVGKAGKRTVRLRLSAADLRTLRRHPEAKLTVLIRFVSRPSGSTLTSSRTVKR